VRLAEGKTPIVDNPTPTPSRIPSSLPKEVASSAIGKFTVQIASYSQESEAQAMAADLKSKGFSAFYVSAKIKGQIWYRVSVGLFTTTKEAEIYKKDLMIRAGVSSALIQKITAAE
jgi:cell division septation protein DedD